MESFYLYCLLIVSWCFFPTRSLERVAAPNRHVIFSLTNEHLEYEWVHPSL